MVRKVDWPPLLGPGRHYLNLSQIRETCVDTFHGQSFSARQILFLELEQIFQELSVAKLPCQLRIDGSFVTEKEIPNDLDVLVAVEFDVMEKLNDEQRRIIDRCNDPTCFKSLDILAFTLHSVGHANFGTALDADAVASEYCLEHGQYYLKGVIVLRVWETNVGLRINR